MPERVLKLGASSPRTSHETISTCLILAPVSAHAFHLQLSISSFPSLILDIYLSVSPFIPCFINKYTQRRILVCVRVGVLKSDSLTIILCANSQVLPLQLRLHSVRGGQMRCVHRQTDLLRMPARVLSELESDCLRPMLI